jgi:capsular polysaccharide biosynthesis protein
LRISTAETALVEQATARHGFVPLHLETLDFHEPAEALFNAECVVGVHGAGMVNILFGRPRPAADAGIEPEIGR